MKLEVKSREKAFIYESPSNTHGRIAKLLSRTHRIEPYLEPKLRFKSRKNYFRRYGQGFELVKNWRKIMHIETYIKRTFAKVTWDGYGSLAGLQGTHRLSHTGIGLNSSDVPSYQPKRLTNWELCHVNEHQIKPRFTASSSLYSWNMWDSINQICSWSYIALKMKKSGNSCFSCKELKLKMWELKILTSRIVVL